MFYYSNVCIDTQTGETEFRERDSTSNDEPLLHYFLPSSYSFHSRRREIKRNPPHSIPPPLIGTTLLYAFVVISESISKKRRKKKTQTFNQMSSSGSNVHSLTASKAKREKKKKHVCVTGPAISIGLLMIIAAIRYLRRIWVLKSRLHSTSFAPCFEREIRSEWGKHSFYGQVEVK